MHDRDGAGLRMGRRTLFAAAAAASAAAFAGCAGRETQPRTTPSPPPSTAPRSSPPTSSSPPPSPAESATKPTAREEIEQALSDRTPQEWGVDVTGTVTTVPARRNRAVLTLDACGGRLGSGYDEQLIATLRDTATPATLFINQRWARANPLITGELVDDPLFEIANHGVDHRPLSVSGRSAYGVPGTADLNEAYEEVVTSRDFFRDTYGLDLAHFRSGTAHTDEVAVRMAAMLGIDVVNFSRNLDGGATYGQAQVSQALAAVQPGDICIGHFNQPASATADGIAEGLSAAAERDIEWTTLGEALGGA